jgi:ribosomal protein S18 acetylase RimI-like enzyme
VQPFYNGIAGGYELPGLSVTREALVTLAEARGYRQVAEYGTPELDLSGDDPLHRLADATRELRAKASRWGLRAISRQLEQRYFPRRTFVELVHGWETVATTAYGLWPEYLRHCRRRLHGLTSVQVAAGWRGRGLGKLIVIEAMEAAKRDGAEGVHLHVWRGNETAWNLYHRALGFQPRHRWITMEKRLQGAGN